MYLKQYKIYEEIPYVVEIETFEKMDSVLISIENEQYSDCPSYWRLGGIIKDTPPLEIAVGMETKVIQRINFFVKEIKSESIKLNIKKRIHGGLLVNTDCFARDLDVIDVQGNYKVWISDGEMICLFGNENEVDSGVISGSLELLLTSSNKLCGFIIRGQKIEDLHYLLQSMKVNG